MLNAQKLLEVNYFQKKNISSTKEFQKELKQEEIYLFSRELNFNDLKKMYSPFLNSKNCTLVIRDFSYRKKGHLKAYLKQNKLTRYELFIQNRDFYIEKFYLFFHELTHLYNDHPINKSLTIRQKEVVADTVPKMMINLLNLSEDLAISPLQKELKLDIYALNWMKGGTLTTNKEKIINQQINSTFLFFYGVLKKYLKTKINPIKFELKITRK